MSMNIGNRIRYLRKSQRRTLQDIADMCGFTKSLLSKIENGKTTPPVATLMKIANSLGVKVSDLLDENFESGTVFTKHSDIPEKMVETTQGYSFYTFAPAYKDKLMQPFLFKAKKGEVKHHTLSHSGQEFLYMLKGKMNYRIGQLEYTLHPGDSVYFDSLEEHMLIPISDEVWYLAVFAEEKP